MPKLHFEDFTVGRTDRFGDLLITEADIIAYARAWDPRPLHLAPPANGETLTASAWHACAMMMKLMCDGFILDTTSLGAPGIDTLDWDEPVRAGDRLHLSYEVLDARRSRSRPELGLVQFRYQMFDATGSRKLICENWAMFGAREVVAA